MIDDRSGMGISDTEGQDVVSGERPPEQVYLDAAMAWFDEGPESPNVRDLAQAGHLRAAVESAWRAGREAAAQDIDPASGRRP
jgi:hypothetical protein